MNVILLVIMGLLYDNAILAAGRYIGEGSILQNLNYVRFWLHALFTPLLVVFAWNTLKQANIKWTNYRWLYYGVILCTVSLIMIELITEVFGLSLEAKREYGVLSYHKVEMSSGPPIMILLVTAVLLVASIFVWVKQKWIWFFIGTVLMIVGSAAIPPIDSGAVTNLFELILITFLLLTKAYQNKRKDGLKF
ncbi:bacteriorhodopsin [Virgibacillus natechei]|uniref:Bacteriorhodopsin n=1 Tax=Virgibacillus natechei TaxID=1216297 RepID=A0ABS4IBV2_9BACI|nr:hypothetical protein [Virgibacillus natechei]MBP1968414.1 bacteriorhodopsin [Virgibacillus natechei]UZD13537.1 hypothetical protein OLD84_02980 [Virgibacillus natechei]